MKVPTYKCEVRKECYPNKNGIRGIENNEG